MLPNYALPNRPNNCQHRSWISCDESVEPDLFKSPMIDDVSTMTLVVVCVVNENISFTSRSNTLTCCLRFSFPSEPLKYIRSPDSRLSFETTRKQNGIKKVSKIIDNRTRWSEQKWKRIPRCQKKSTHRCSSMWTTVTRTAWKSRRTIAPFRPSARRHRERLRRHIRSKNRKLWPRTIFLAVLLKRV